jgi:hypothetical protein
VYAVLYRIVFTFTRLVAVSLADDVLNVSHENERVHVSHGKCEAFTPVKVRGFYCPLALSQPLITCEG